MRQLGADGRAHHFAADQLERLCAGDRAGALADRLALRRHFLVGHDLTLLGLAQLAEHAVDQLVLLDVGLDRQTDQRVVRGAEVGHLHLAEAHLLDDVPGLVDVRGLRVLDLDHRAAGELDRQVQSLGDQEEHRGDEGDERDRVEDQRVLHEGDVPFDSEEFHGLCALF